MAQHCMANFLPRLRRRIEVGDARVLRGAGALRSRGDTLHPALPRKRGREECELRRRVPQSLRMIGWLIGAAIAGPLAGCSWVDPPVEPQARLALACETVRCECRIPQSRFTFSKAPPAPIVWRSDGSASCPEGYLLSRVTP
jgi:hypothetical protein